MTRLPYLCLLVLLLTGCSDAGQEETSAAASATQVPTVTSTTTEEPATGVDYDLDLAVDICTAGLSGPDAAFLDAVDAARAGTRSVSEINDMFREIQDDIEDQATRAEEGELPRLAQALQTYADTIGQARVSGTAGLDELISSRETIDAACFLPAGPTT